MTVLGAQDQIQKCMAQDLNQILFVAELEPQYINIMYDTQKKNIAEVIGDINSQVWIWVLTTWVTDILFLLGFPYNYPYKKGI